MTEDQFRALEGKIDRVLDEERKQTERVAVLLDIAVEDTPLDREVKREWLARETVWASVRDITRDAWVRRALAFLIAVLGLGLLAWLGVAIDLPELVRAARGVP